MHYRHTGVLASQESCTRFLSLSLDITQVSLDTESQDLICFNCDCFDMTTSFCYQALPPNKGDFPLLLGFLHRIRIPALVDPRRCKTHDFAL